MRTDWERSEEIGRVKKRWGGIWRGWKEQGEVERDRERWGGIGSGGEG